MKKSVQFILNGLSMPIFVVDPDGAISFMNKVAQTRYKKAKAGKSFTKVISSKKCTGTVLYDL